MNYAELKGAIRAKFKTQAKFAEAIHLAPCTVSMKLNGKSEWSTYEIQRACEALNIAPEELHRYFFCLEC